MSLPFIVVTIAAIIRLIFAAIIPLFPDETYYWEWSRHIAAGYFDHPSGVALITRLGSVLLAPFGGSASAPAVRLGAIISGWVASMAVVAIARRIGDDPAALRAAVVISVLPLAAAGLILDTPDAPLLATAGVGLYCVVRALQTAPRSAGSLRWWIATGVALGLAFSSKYTSIFLPVGVVAAIILRPTLRVRLREAGPYVACAIATLIFVPVLVWNAQHEWISFLFQLRHGLAAPEGSALRAAWRHEGDFFGGQAGLASPILFVMMGIVVAQGLRRAASDVRFVLAMVALISFGFFFYSAFRQRVEPNWPAPAYVPAIALLASMQWSSRGEKWFRSGVIFALVMSLLIYAQGVAPVLPIPPRKDPIGRAFGWADLTDRVTASARHASAATHSTTWLGGDRYQEASELAFHTIDHPVTFATNLSGRINQYALWPQFPDRAHSGENLVLVLDESEGPHDVIKALAPFFDAAERGELVSMRRGSGEIATRRIWTLLRWRGGWPAAR